MWHGSFGMLGMYGAALTPSARRTRWNRGTARPSSRPTWSAHAGGTSTAILLGLMVTFTHSFSIILLGLTAKYFSVSFSDQQLHGYLGIFASLIILVLGFFLIRSRWQALRHPGADHGHHHLFGSPHHDHFEVLQAEPHEHEHVAADGTISRHSHAERSETDKLHEGGRLGLAGLAMLGFSGGIIPCPAALALLLASLSVGALGRGLVLVLVFSSGLALALVAVGLLVVNSVRASARFVDTERYAPGIALASALLVTLVGGYTFYSSLIHFMNP